MGREISKATLGRIPEYLKYLIFQSDAESISATTIAKGLGYGEVQVRKDLAHVCGKGKPKIGYSREELIGSLSEVLSCDEGKAVIVGAGKLGTALYEYDGFSEYGIQICAAFDNKYENEFATSSGKTVYPIEKLSGYCKENGIGIGIITVPASSAQATLDLLYESGIKRICSFAPCKLDCPPDATVRYENLALSIAHLKPHSKS